MSKGQYKKIDIIVTDCDNEVVPNVVEWANEEKTTFYVVAVGVSAVDGLKKLALGTGGMYWENLNSQEEIEAVVDKIYQWEQFGQPCTLEWVSSGCETAREASIRIDELDISKKVYYKVPANVLPSLELSPSNSIVFGKVIPGNKSEKQIKLTARNAPVTIYGISSSDPKFIIKDWGGSEPEFTLAPGESRTLTIEFTPVDSTYTLAKFDINSNVCSGSFFCASGGYSSVPPKKTTLAVVFPNGGETFGTGSDTVIKWDGVMPHEKIRLDYSTDAGSTWNMITDKASNLAYPWHVPATVSDRCLMKAMYSSQSNGNMVVLAGHKGSVYSVSWDSYGFGLLGATDGGIDVWDVESETVQNRILTPGKSNNTVAWSPDGQYIASGQSGGDINIYTQAGSPYSALVSHTDDVMSIAWSPDAGRLVSGSSDGTVKLWDIASKKLLHTFVPGADWVQSVAFSPDGKTIAAGSSNNTVELWEAGTKQHIRTLGGFAGSVYSVAFSPDSRHITAGSSDKTIRIWDLADAGSPVIVLDGHKGTVYSVAFSPDGDNLASGGGDQDIIIWDWRAKTVVNRLRGHTASVLGLTWSPDGVYIASGSSDKTIRVWLMYASTDQNDVSDSLWKIVAPLAECHEVDMGSVTINEEKDSLVMAYIVNNEQIPVTVNKIIAGGGFDLVSPKLPVTIQPGDGLDAQFRFAPNDFGQITATIFSITQSDTLSCTIKGEGIYPYKHLDFGSVTFCDLKTDTVIINNPSNKDVTLESYSITGADKNVFSVIKAPAANTTLTPSGSSAYIIGFQPTKNANGIKKAVLEIETTNKELPVIKVDLLGTAWSYVLSANPVGVDFGKVAVLQNGNRKLGISNSGQADAKIRDVISDNPDITITPKTAVVKPGEEAPFGLNWTPSAEGSMSSMLKIIIGEPCPDTMEVAVTGEAIDNELVITNSVDFGAVAWCEDKTDSVVILSAVEAAVIINEMTIGGPDYSMFGFSDNITLPMTLNKGERLVRIIKYNGSASTDGIKTADIKTKAVIDRVENEFTTSLKAERVSASISSDPFALSFNDLMPGAKDTKKITIKNESKLPVEIIEIKAKSYPAVYAITPNSNITLAPDQEQVLDIEFHPQSPGSYADELDFTLKLGSCEDNKHIQINGKAIGNTLEATAWLPDTSAWVGDRNFGIPLMIKFDKDTIIKDLSYTAKIRFNATTYEPKTAFGAIFLSNRVSNGDRIVELIGTKAIVTNSDTVLGAMSGAVYIGSSDVTDLIVEEIKLSDTQIKVARQNGILRVKGLCQQNMSRIKLMDNIALSVAPNPASDEAEITVTGEAKGEVTINIYSIEGLKKASIGINKTAWQANEKINLKDYPAGVYRLVLQSGDEYQTVPMVVVK